MTLDSVESVAFAPVVVGFVVIALMVPALAILLRLRRYEPALGTGVLAAACEWIVAGLVVGWLGFAVRPLAVFAPENAAGSVVVFSVLVAGLGLSVLLLSTSAITHGMGQILDPHGRYRQDRRWQRAVAWGARSVSVYYVAWATAYFATALSALRR